MYRLRRFLLMVQGVHYSCLPEMHPPPAAELPPQVSLRFRETEVPSIDESLVCIINPLERHVARVPSPEIGNQNERELELIVQAVELVHAAPHALCNGPQPPKLQRTSIGACHRGSVLRVTHRVLPFAMLTRPF